MQDAGGRIGSSPGATPVLAADFREDPGKDGWTYVCQPVGGACVGETSERTKTEDLSRAHGLFARSGYWESPPFAVRPFDYYRTEFCIRAEGDGYFWVFFDDPGGRELVADHCTSYYASPDASRQVVCFRAQVEAASARARFAPREGKALFVERIEVRQVRREEVAAWADSVYAVLPPLRYGPAPGRWKHARRSMEKLRGGATLRVVMLGDSIVNDTANSVFDVLVERLYPGSRVEVVSSVRGGGGCRFYRRSGNVREHVLDLEPDLLMIGGICHGGDTDSVREVIRQVRAEADPDILLMTGPAGRHGDPRVNPDWHSIVTLDGEGYAARLMRLAAEEKCEFLDMAAPWGLCIEGSGKDYGFFMRDDTHVNARGRQVLARILEAYFGPK
jgi:hypothetical protein